jgi:hypothetical protein
MLFRPIVLVAVVLIPAIHGAAPGADFRVETQIYVGDAEEPASENLTLFHAGIVYDFLNSPTEIAVFKKSPDGNGGRFILLDAERQWRAEITTEQLLKFLNELKAFAAAQDDPLLKFSANPRFEEHFDPARGELRMESDVIRYFVVTLPTDDTEGMAQFREFSDWYGRLGAVTHMGSAPPFPRLEVNAALARHVRLPQRVYLTIPARRPYRAKDVVLRAEHEVQWRLSRRDLARIDDVNADLVKYEPVTYDRFVRKDEADTRRN